MNEIERKKVKEIDELILKELKGRLDIKKASEGILPDDEMEQICSKINEKKKVIFLLFQGDFSVNERSIEEKMEIGRTDLSFYDRVANNIILRRLDGAIQKVENLNPICGRVISVCFDRKSFIQNVLNNNIPLSFVAKHIQSEMER